MKIVYLTGGIATGKSTVAKMFKENGFYVIDSDELVHRSMSKDGPAYKAVLEHFGSEFLKEDGEIDRKKLARLIFSNNEEKRKLESIIHPLTVSSIREEIEKAERENQQFVLIEIPLLFELNLNLRPVITVFATRNSQIERLMRRDGLSRQEAELRISSQISVEEKAKLSDFVISSECSLNQSYEQVRNVIERIKNL